MFRLESNFRDYYDEYVDNNSSLVYTRIRSNSTRSENLQFLENNGIKTVKYGAFSKFSPMNRRLVVYTNPTKHDFLGKHIYTYNEVASQYSNCMVAEFISKCNGNSMKYLQIGERRFRLMFHNPDYKEVLREGKLESIEELPKQFNYGIGLPIYSIDYVSNGIEMLAVDFNEVQKLDTIGISEILKPDEVIREVKNALYEYNKI